MPRGGKRTGQVGQAYTNRSDLNKASNQITQSSVEGLTALPYGQKQDLQQAVANTPQQPLGAPPAPPGAPPTAPGVEPAGPTPGAAGAFSRPTARPGEPITHGLASGPGAGPEILGLNQSNVGDFLRQLAAQPYASPEVQLLLEAATRNR